ncbi:ABC transporter substrate-binding protein [Leifsonia poae]|uniref:ABC transporter substrate-binding protein n=1 Tax=Leifsonia poae TaxID=110933 RepID=UPI001CBE51C5|nr:ABC transporter substrate-binding protein [Leifsonia poae]
MRFTRAIGAVGAATVAVLAATSLAGCQAVITTPEPGKTTAATTVAGLPTAIASKGYIVLADSGSVKPLKYTESGSDVIIGLVPDLAAEYARRLGVTAKIERVAGDSVVPGVLAGRFDAGLALGDFAQRRETLDFVDILAGGQVLLVKKGNPAGVSGMDDLCGHSIAIVKGSNQQTVIDEYQAKCVTAGKPAIDVQAYADGPTSILALSSGRVEVAYDDIADANYLVKENPGLYQVTGDYQWLAPYGVGIPKADEDLTKAIQKAMQSMVDDGTYQKILAKYGQESIALKKIEINGSKF